VDELIRYARQPALYLTADLVPISQLDAENTTPPLLALDEECGGVCGI